MSRLVPYRTKVSEEVAARIEQTLSTTMYLVQTTGPTSYVVSYQQLTAQCVALTNALTSSDPGAEL